MPIRPVHQAVIIAFGLSLSGLAFARNPPALVKQQEAFEPGASASRGYRDINWRFGIIPERAPGVMTVAGGYRDILVRFGRPARLPTHVTSASMRARWR